MSSIKKNLSLQTAYQVLTVITPLITAPYLARVLGTSQLGVFSYTNSIVAYFAVVAMLGTVNYGTRTIASVKDNQNDRDKVFTCIFIFQLAVTLVSILAYAVYMLFFCVDNRLVSFLQSITLIGCIFDITWVYFGVEDFKTTVVVSLFNKILTVLLILLLVKQSSDLWVYTIIILGGTLVTNILLFINLPRYVSFKRVSIKDVSMHIKPNLILFIPLLAMSVYHTMDKTMLGLLSSFEQSGYYYNSDKVVSMPYMVIYGVGTVMLPRMTALLTDRKQIEANQLFMTTMDGIAAICVAVSCGIAAVANEFIPLFYGEGYDPCILITIVFTPVLLAKSFSVISRTQYLIPMNMEKEYIKSVVWGAIINLIFNFILIPLYGALGATVSTVLAEFVSCAVQFFSLRGKKLGISRLLIKTLMYSMIGMMMIVIVRIIAIIDAPVIVVLMIEVLSGGCFYCLTCFLFWKKTNNQFYAIMRNAIKRISD